MKKYVITLMFALLVPWSQAHASQVGFSAGISIAAPGFGVSIGVPGVVPAPVAPAYYPEPAAEQPYYAEPVVIDEPPQFVQPPELGFYVAVGTPYDLFFLNNLYYLCFGNVWYTSPYYNGPWSTVYSYNVPYAFTRYPFDRIHYYRDYYYGRYQRYGGWSGYNHFRPGWHGTGRQGYYGNRHDYARPYATGQNNWNRPAYSGGHSPGQGYGNRPAYSSRPYSPANGNGAGYNTPYTAGQGYGNRPNYSRPYNPSQVNRYATANTGSNYPAQRTWNRPAYGNTYSPGQTGGNGRYYSRPSYSAPYNQGRVSWNRPAYSNSNAFGSVQGGGHGNTFSRPVTSGQGSWSRPSFTGSGQGSMGRPAGFASHGSSHGGFGAGGHGR